MAAIRVGSKIRNCYSSINKSYEYHYQYRSIFTTSHLQNSWINKVKNVFTGQKTTTEGSAAGDTTQLTPDSFTLIDFADQMKKARKIGAFKDFMVGRCSEATISTAFQKYEAIISYLGALDPTGENLKMAQKQEAAKHCNCTITDVENALAKYTWAKEAQKKVAKLQQEGKPIPTSIHELQKVLGSTPVDLANSNLAKSGQISRNALCPCGSKKRYKREQAMTYIQDVCILHPWSRSICIEDRTVGFISISPGSGDDRCRAEIGFAIAANYWGQGICTKAVKDVVSQVFNDIPYLVRLEALVSVENIASQRVLEKTGFLREGILRKYSYVKGTLKDIAIFSLLSE